MVVGTRPRRSMAGRGQFLFERRQRDQAYLRASGQIEPKNLDKSSQADLTDRFDALCSHYGMMPTRNNKGVAHENGSIESPNGHLKRAIEDALVMGGSRDFESLQDYRRFIDEIVGRSNARNAKRIDAERASLRPLPTMIAWSCSWEALPCQR